MEAFSIFGESAGNGISHNRPAAAEEHKIIINFHNQSNLADGIDHGKIYASVVGYMTNEFTYSSTGNYKNIYENLFPDNVITRAISDETQRNMMNYGYTTKKMYSNGESPTLTVEFMCYAGDVDGGIGLNDGKATYTDPVAIAEILVNATLPKVASGNMMLATNLGKLINENAPLAIVETVGKAYEGAKSVITDGKVDWVAINSAVNKFTSQKPPVCILKIGNIFEKDMMVVKRVEVTLSKEYIRKGVPLYGKYSVTFESLFNAANIVDDSGANNASEKASIFGSGLKNVSPTNKDRVSFV